MGDRRRKRYQEEDILNKGVIDNDITISKCVKDHHWEKYQKKDSIEENVYRKSP